MTTKKTGSVRAVRFQRGCRRRIGVGLGTARRTPILNLVVPTAASKPATSPGWTGIGDQTFNGVQCPGAGLVPKATATRSSGRSVRRAASRRTSTSVAPGFRGTCSSRSYTDGGVPSRASAAVVRRRNLDAFPLINPPAGTTTVPLRWRHDGRVRNAGSSCSATTPASCSSTACSSSFPSRRRWPCLARLGRTRLLAAAQGGIDFSQGWDTDGGLGRRLLLRSRFGVFAFGESRGQRIARCASGSIEIGEHLVVGVGDGGKAAKAERGEMRSGRGLVVQREQRGGKPLRHFRGQLAAQTSGGIGAAGVSATDRNVLAVAASWRCNSHHH